MLLLWLVVCFLFALRAQEAQNQKMTHDCYFRSTWNVLMAAWCQGKGGMSREGGKARGVCCSGTEWGSREELARPVVSEELDQVQGRELELPDTGAGWVEHRGAEGALLQPIYSASERGKCCCWKTALSELAMRDQPLFPQLFKVWALCDIENRRKFTSYMMRCFLELVRMWRNDNKILFLNR